MRAMTNAADTVTRGTATPEQDLTFQGWRAEALLMMPYMAPVLFSFRLVSTPGLGTFAVDRGHRLYVDFDAVSGWGSRKCAEVLLHECSHLLQEHAALAEVARVRDDERRTWNAAADFSINDDLRDAGCAEIAKGGLLPEQIGAPDYLTAPAYMDLLRQKQQQQGQKSQQSQQQGDDPFRGCGSGSGGQSAPVELPGDDDMGGQAPAAGSVERELVKINTAASIREHVSRKGIGSVPAGLRQFADMQLAPTTTPWERIMQTLVRKFVKKRQGTRDVDLTRRSRRHMDARLGRADGTAGRRIIVPGWKHPIPSVRYYRDTSGSMGEDDLERVSREVLTISRRLGVRGPDLIVQDVDTEVYDAKKFTGAQVLKEVTGRGGTSMVTAIEHAWNLPKNERPAVVVIATDGGTSWPAHAGPVPVVVLLVGTDDHLRSTRDSTPPWAHTVEVSTDEMDRRGQAVPA